MRTLVGGVLLVLCACGGPADAGVTELTLDNGLTVLLQPIEGHTKACVLVNFTVGGDHDPEGASGLAHIVEHLYFTCAAGDIPARTAEEAMRAYPNGWQAQTGQEYTVIAAVVEPAKLQDEITAAAARMGDLKITKADVDREIVRVRNEVASMFGEIPTNPGLVAFNHAREAIAPSPSGARRGGIPAEVETFTAEQTMDFWRRYLKPANATLVITGAFDAAKVEAHVRTCFGKIPKGEAPEARAGAAPQYGTTRVDVPRIGPGVPAPHVITVAYAAPTPDDPLFPAFLIQIARLVGQSMMGGRGAQQFPPPVYFAFLDSPEAVYVSRLVGSEQTGNAVLEQLTDDVDKTTSRSKSGFDAKRVASFLGFLLGIGPGAGVGTMSDPYGVAFSLARRRQMGLDAATLEKALAAVTNEDLAVARATFFEPTKRAVAEAVPKD